jgi:hypothetical protein
MRQMRPRDNVVLHDRDQWSSSWAEPIKFGRSPSNTVPKEGLEPSHPKAQEPKSCVSTSSTTPARVLISFAAAFAFDCFASLGDGVYRWRSRLSLSTCPVAFTLYCATAIVPSPFWSTSMTNVERITPLINFP